MKEQLPQQEIKPYRLVRRENALKMRTKTNPEAYIEGGRSSASIRFNGLSREQISAMMRAVAAGRKVKNTNWSKVKKYYSEE